MPQRLRSTGTKAPDSENAGFQFMAMSWILAKSLGYMWNF